MQWFTVALTGVAAAIPAMLPFIPPPYGAAIGGAVAALGALYHLFQPAPK